MHLLPQSEIFRIAKVTDCLPLEVQPDWLARNVGSVDIQYVSVEEDIRRIPKRRQVGGGGSGVLDSKLTLAKKLRHLGSHKNNAEIIDAAYRGILGRHADQEGMQHYTRIA